jgi:hypothetical protein
MEKNVVRWMELCELAAKEPDPNRLMKLTEEIVRLLDKKRKTVSSLQDNSRFE